MVDVRRLVSAVLLALGVLLVFLGMSTALGFTPGGLAGSAAAIAALLYAGAVWFTPSRPAIRSAAAVPIVFDRNLLMVTGPAQGQLLAALFPEAVRAELDQQCTAALNGVPGRFVSGHRGRTIAFEVVPVRSADGVIVYGLLVSAESMPQARVASA